MCILAPSFTHSDWHLNCFILNATQISYGVRIVSFVSNANLHAYIHIRSQCSPCLWVVKRLPYLRSSNLCAKRGIYINCVKNCWKSCQIDSIKGFQLALVNSSMASVRGSHSFSTTWMGMRLVVRIEKKETSLRMCYSVCFLHSDSNNGLDLLTLLASACQIGPHTPRYQSKVWRIASLKRKWEKGSKISDLVRVSKMVFSCFRPGGESDVRCIRIGDCPRFHCMYFWFPPRPGSTNGTSCSPECWQGYRGDFKLYMIKKIIFLLFLCDAHLWVCLLYV